MGQQQCTRQAHTLLEPSAVDVTKDGAQRAGTRCHVHRCCSHGTSRLLLLLQLLGAATQLLEGCGSCRGWRGLTKKDTIL